MTYKCSLLRIEQLAYGLWVTKDRRVVVFNRNYSPIWQRQMPAGDWEKADGNEWVKNVVRQMWFYDGRYNERVSVDRAINIMVRLGILGSEHPSSQQYRRTIEEYSLGVRRYDR